MTKNNRIPTEEKIADTVEPYAPALIESLRAFGYDLPTALADLVDNSLFHDARKVSVHFHWAGEQSAIALADDGSGMDEKTLVNAMRVGSRNPRDMRDPKDFGRFGLGLKTASFSQCRRLTVFTRQGSGQSLTRCWDLDHVAQAEKWQLLRSASPLAASIASDLSGRGAGTVIVWEKLDRLTSGTDVNNDSDEDAFLRQAEQVGEYFAAVFHRMMTGSRAVTFALNGTPLKPWDPFLTHVTATQRMDLEKLPFHGGFVEVEPFVLPHLSKLDAETHRAAAGIRGWNAHQGFYVYRNRRLLVLGDWLGIRGWRQEEHYKLARIKIDLPNSMDHEWKIDVTKSRARPPEELRRELTRIGEYTRSQAKKVYSFRGAKLVPHGEKERVFLWEQVVRHSQVSYHLNRKHPLLIGARAACTDSSKFNALLRLVEETIPVPLITITDREQPDRTASPFGASKEKEILEIMRQVLASLQSNGLSGTEALLRLSCMEPFPQFPQLLQTIKEESEHA